MAEDMVVRWVRRGIGKRGEGREVVVVDVVRVVAERVRKRRDALNAVMYEMLQQF